MKLLKIGIVGCGAIGGSLANTVVRDLAAGARLSALYDLDCPKARLLARSFTNKKIFAADSLEQLISKSDLVIEAAGANCAGQIAREVIAWGKDVMIMSVGGIVSSFPALVKAGKRAHARIYIPSGAIAGIDALKAANLGKISRVILTTRKNPQAFRGVKYIEEKKIDLNKIKEDTVIFSGNAQQAMKFFPQNINVAGILSLAGIGPAKTRVNIIACPGVSRNIHEIEIVSPAGRIFTRTENVLHPQNPKTSYLAVLSAVATLKQILQLARVGT